MIRQTLLKLQTLENKHGMHIKVSLAILIRIEANEKLSDFYPSLISVSIFDMNRDKNRSFKNVLKTKKRKVF